MLKFGKSRTEHHLLLLLLMTDLLVAETGRRERICVDALIVCVCVCVWYTQLMASPQVLSTGVFVTVLRMIVIMCASCPDLAVLLLKQSKSGSALFVQ